MSVIVTRPDGTKHVIDEKPDGVWTHHCGSQLFHLLEDGLVSCAECDEVLYSMSWTRHLKQ